MKEETKKITLSKKEYLGTTDGSMEFDKKLELNDYFEKENVKYVVTRVHEELRAISEPLLDKDLTKYIWQ